MVPRLTPSALREFWDSLPEDARPLHLWGEEITTPEDLIALHAGDPRKVERGIAAMDRAARAGLKRRAKEIETEMKAKERKADELDHAHAFVERLQGVGVGDLDEETFEALKDL